MNPTTACYKGNARRLVPKELIKDSTVIGTVANEHITFEQIKSIILLFCQGKLNTLAKDHPLTKSIPPIFRDYSDRLKEKPFIFIVMLLRGVLESTLPITVQILNHISQIVFSVGGRKIVDAPYTTLDPAIEISIHNNWLMQLDTNGIILLSNTYQLHQEFRLLKEPPIKLFFIVDVTKYLCNRELAIGLLVKGAGSGFGFTNSFNGLYISDSCIEIGNRDSGNKLTGNPSLRLSIANNKLGSFYGRFVEGDLTGTSTIQISDKITMQCNMIKCNRDLGKPVKLTIVANPNVTLEYHGLCDKDDRPSDEKGILIHRETDPKSHELLKTKIYTGIFEQGYYPVLGSMQFFYCDGSKGIRYRGQIDPLTGTMKGNGTLILPGSTCAQTDFRVSGTFNDNCKIEDSAKFVYCSTPINPIPSSAKQIPDTKGAYICATGIFQLSSPTNKNQKYVANKAQILFYGNEFNGTFEFQQLISPERSNMPIVNKYLSTITIKLQNCLITCEISDKPNTQQDFHNVTFNFSESEIKFTGRPDITLEHTINSFRITAIECKDAIAVIGREEKKGHYKLMNGVLTFVINDTGDKYQVNLNTDTALTVHPNGNMTKQYTGQFKAGQFEGKGVYTECDSEGNTIKQYTGQFKQDEFNGTGQLVTFNNGKQCTYNGEFKSGELVTGTIAIANEKRIFYIRPTYGNQIIGVVTLENCGQYKAIFYEGDIYPRDKIPTLTYPDGAIYNGQFDPVSGETSGYGCITYNDKKYTGEFTGQKFPTGTVKITTSSNRLIFEGTVDNKGHLVQGTCYYSNGASFTGTFDDTGTIKSGEYKTPYYIVKSKGFVVKRGITSCRYCNVTLLNSHETRELEGATFTFNMNNGDTTIQHEDRTISYSNSSSPDCVVKHDSAEVGSGSSDNTRHVATDNDPGHLTESIYSTSDSSRIDPQTAQMYTNWFYDHATGLYKSIAHNVTTNIYTTWIYNPQTAQIYTEWFYDETSHFYTLLHYDATTNKLITWNYNTETNQYVTDRVFDQLVLTHDGRWGEQYIIWHYDPVTEQSTKHTHTVSSTDAN